MMSDTLANELDLRPRITVIGVGGAGCNAVNNMIDANLSGVDFVVANTDAQSLAASHADHKVQLGARLTEGLGAGSRPEIGEAAAEEALEDIRAVVAGSHMVFIAAGMGGGTGTGAASVIARIARDAGILTVAVVTKPFQFEGARRMRIAEAGVAELRQFVDTLIVIPNQNLFRIASERTTFAEAFILADQVLYSGVACIVDLIVKEGLINLDFADVRTVMSGMGTAMMGTGEATGEHRAIMAAEEAIANPLLDDVSLSGAKGLLLSITGGPGLTLYEVDEAATRVRQEVDPEANIIVGATYDESMGDRVRVSIVASGMQRQLAGMTPPQMPAYAPAPVRGGANGLASSHPADTEGAAGSTGAPQSSRAEDEAYQQIAAALHQPEAGSASTYEQSHPSSQATFPATAGHDGQPGSGGASGSSWHGPDDIEIEEVSPGAMTRQSPVPPVHHAQAPPPGTDSSVFTPAPPAQVRRAPRRMPDVDDFPVVGQRDYYAKSAQQRRAPQGQGLPSSRQPAEPRRRGFFERLTGRGRTESDSLADRQQIDSGYRAHAHPHHHPANVTYASESDHGAAAREGDEHRREADLPALFSKSRR